jgi:2-polyprenyl-6-methoxyphenol hydroxylase-like FAD-dependent oxidoreductase
MNDSFSSSKKLKPSGGSKLAMVSDMTSDLDNVNVTSSMFASKEPKPVQPLFPENNEEMTGEINTEVDIVVVGGGPVGLWTAVQIKIRRPTTRIIVFEKYEEYRRSHVVIFEPSSFEEAAEHQLLQKLKSDIIQDKKMRTNDLENVLVSLANELGIPILKPVNISNPLQLRQQFPNAKVLIGADGARSIIRDTFFKNEFRYQDNLQYLVEIKYEAEGPTKQYANTVGGYKTMKVMEVLVTEVVGRYKEEENKTPVTLRLVVKKELYDKCTDATFKNPYRMPQDNERVDPELLQKIRIWLNAKKLFSNEKVIEESIKITATKLDAYASKAFVAGDGVTTVVLVGDAAFGVPFFRSMNNGLLSGTRLSLEVVAYLNNDTSPSEMRLSDSVIGSVPPQFANYARYVKRLSKTERVVASVKSSGLDVANWYTDTSAKVPWQVAKWNEDEINALYSGELAQEEYEYKSSLKKMSSTMSDSFTTSWSSNKKKLK